MEDQNKYIMMEYLDPSLHKEYTIDVYLIERAYRNALCRV